MDCNKKYKTTGFHIYVPAFMFLLMMQLSVHSVFAQEPKTATIKLKFEQTDSTKTCTATVTSDTALVRGTEVQLYVKTMYALLAVGKKVATDDNGVAVISFPTDLPGDQHSMLTVIAKIEKGDVYGAAEAQETVKWGAKPKYESVLWGNRSLSASREKAPMFLVIASTLIIIVIWGTIFYIIYQIFRIKKAGKLVKKLNQTDN